jgi:ABC-type branched-subunit amino acid transport system ATPase component
VLTGVDLRIGGGEVVALVGANGCGKTTLLNVVNGYYPIDGGTVAVNGAATTGAAVRRVAAAGLGRTFQVPKLVEDLTVRENVELGIVARERQRALAATLRLPGFRHRERSRAEQATAICRALGFDDATIDGPASHLSLGLKRIAEIGRAIAGGATVICLDEPAAGLNDDERARLGRLCRALADTGRSVLLVEHHLRFVLDLCDRLVLLDGGVVAGDGRPSDPSTFGPALEQYLGTYLVDFNADQAAAAV